MSDWRNTVPMIVNKTRFQLYATKYDDLEKVKQVFQEHDRNQDGNLDKLELSLLMKKIGIFLSTQELTAVYSVFDLNKDGRVNFPEFVQTLRVGIADRRTL